MRHSILTALTHHQVQMDKNIQEAIDAYCQPENIKRIIDDAAFQALDNAIKEEVKNFFWKGEGRMAIAEAVKKKLLNRESYTALDDVK